MIILVNGPAQVGKTTAARRLAAYFDRAATIDADSACFLHPAESDADGNADYRSRALRHLLEFHVGHGYGNFVISDHWRTGAGIRRLRQLLAEVDEEVHTFRLTCSEPAMRRRLAAAGAAEVEHALRHFREDDAALKEAARGADLGFPLDTSALAPAQAAEAIWQNVREDVGLSPHHGAWAEAFAAEKERILRAAGGLVRVVHHIGSSAVPGLAAKPIIDLMAVVRDLDDALLCIAPLQPLGYVFVDYPQNTDRRFFRKGFPRTHHLHVVAESGATLADHLDFRDALRTRPDLRERYGRLKVDLAQQFAHDRMRYGTAKSAFVEQALREYRGLPLHPLAE